MAISCVTGWPLPAALCTAAFGFAAPAVHLERRRAEAAHDEGAVAVGRAVEIALLGRAQVVAGDHDAVRVRVIVEVHVLRFVERRLHRVVAGRHVGGIPVGDGGTGGDVQDLAVRGELRVVQDLSSLLLVGVDLPGPALDRDPAAGHGLRGILPLGADHGRNEHGESYGDRGTVDETHNVSFHGNSNSNTQLYCDRPVHPFDAPSSGPVNGWPSRFADCQPETVMRRFPPAALDTAWRFAYRSVPFLQSVRASTPTQRGGAHGATWARQIVGVACAAICAIVFGSATGAQSDPIVGSWRLDIAHSTYKPGPPPRGHWYHRGGG